MGSDDHQQADRAKQEQNLHRRSADPAEVASIIGQCSATAATGIRKRAMLTQLYRSVSGSLSCWRCAG
jgi:hypothetical protein